MKPWLKRLIVAALLWVAALAAVGGLVEGSLTVMLLVAVTLTAMLFGFTVFFTLLIGTYSWVESGDFRFWGQS